MICTYPRGFTLRKPLGATLGASSVLCPSRAIQVSGLAGGFDLICSLVYILLIHAPRPLVEAAEGHVHWIVRAVHQLLLHRIHGNLRGLSPGGRRHRLRWKEKRWCERLFKMFIINSYVRFMSK